MIYYDTYSDPNRIYGFCVERKVIMMDNVPGEPDAESFFFETFEEAFKFYEEMYRMDKACWELLKDKFSDDLCDESKHASEYSFSLPKRYLAVKIVNMLDVACEAFRLKKGQLHG